MKLKVQIIYFVVNFCFAVIQKSFDGNKLLKEARRIADEDDDYEAAAELIWRAMTLDGSVDYSEAARQFFEMHHNLGTPETAYSRLAHQYFKQGQPDSAHEMIKLALKANPSYVEAHMILVRQASDDEEKIKLLNRISKLPRLKAVDHYSLGTEYFRLKKNLESLAHMERAYALDKSHAEALSGLVYMRTNLCIWGANGEIFKKDMEDIIGIAEKYNGYRRNENVTAISANQRKNKLTKILKKDIILPHMSLAYPIPVQAKLAIARAHAEKEKQLVISANLTIHDHSKRLNEYRKQSSKSNFRIRVGFISTSFKSKAILYLAYAMFKYFDRTKFEIHVFATAAPDPPEFISLAMRGVDWRKEVETNVEHFHAVHGVAIDTLAEKIRKLGIHFLVDWDGYANNGIRSAGLLPQQIAPIQIVHQEYIGTLGASYVQYTFGDPISTPFSHRHDFSEKLILLPRTGVCNMYAHDRDNFPLPKKAATREPQLRGCDANSYHSVSSSNDDEKASFVFCSFNKHLKFDPDTFTNWLHILSSVNNSMMCLLENPIEAKKFLVHFIHHYNPDRVARVRWMPFIANPYDNQQRISKFCNAVLDTRVYNGHTTTYDALWGGVPVVVLDGPDRDFGARIGVSTMDTLGIPELITHSESEYRQVAVRLAIDYSFYKRVRSKIVATCHQEEPKHTLWDVERYTGSFELGLQEAWWHFLTGLSPRIVFVDDAGAAALSLEQRKISPWIFNFSDAVNYLDMDPFQQYEIGLIDKLNFLSMVKSKKNLRFIPSDAKISYYLEEVETLNINISNAEARTATTTDVCTSDNSNQSKSKPYLNVNASASVSCPNPSDYLTQGRRVCFCKSKLKSNRRL